ncbi:hypothetical protein AVEN_181219-1 [Araneus ventricosus]|uniref:Uncharacterized protein n=1 Tax=Araneus ventricosus TaxID=182803 RepID=A0A4Y2VU56_ARAVE|nr:hypothetical protein AVEN_181219-1 [Araneus ventricosus]
MPLILTNILLKYPFVIITPLMLENPLLKDPFVIRSHRNKPTEHNSKEKLYGYQSIDKTTLNLHNKLKNPRLKFSFNKLSETSITQDQREKKINLTVTANRNKSQRD